MSWGFVDRADSGEGQGKKAGQEEAPLEILIMSNPNKCALQALQSGSGVLGK